MDPAPANKPPLDDQRVDHLSQPSPTLTSPTLFGESVRNGDTFWWGGAEYKIKSLEYSLRSSVALNLPYDTIAGDTSLRWNDTLPSPHASVELSASRTTKTSPVILSAVALQDIHISIPVYREEDIVPTKLPYVPANESGLSSGRQTTNFNIASVFSPGSKFYGYTYETAGRFVSETAMTMTGILKSPISWKNYFKCNNSPSEQSSDVVCRSLNTSSNSGYNQSILRIKDGGTVITPILTAYTVVKYSPTTKEAMLGDDGIPVVVTDDSGKSLNVSGDGDGDEDDALSSTQFRLSLATLISLLLSGIGFTALFYALPRNDMIGNWGSGVIFIILILSAILGFSARFWFKEGTNIASYITGLSTVNIIGTVLIFMGVVGMIMASAIGGESMKAYTSDNTNHYIFTTVTLLILAINQILSISYTSPGIKNDSESDYKDGYAKQPLFHFTIANIITYLPKFFLAMSLATSGPLTNIFSILRLMYLFTSPPDAGDVEKAFKLSAGSGIPTNLTKESIQAGIENIVTNINNNNPLSASANSYSAEILSGLETLPLIVTGGAGESTSVPNAYILKHTLGKIFAFFTTKKLPTDGSDTRSIVKVITSEIVQSSEGGNYKVTLPPTPDGFTEISAQSLLSSTPGNFDVTGTYGFIAVLVLVAINIYFTLSKTYSVSQKEDPKKRRSIVTMDTVVSLIVLFVIIYYFGGGVLKNGVTYGITTGTFIVTAAIPVIQQIVNLIGS